MNEIRTVYTSSLLTLDGKFLDESEWKPGDMVKFLYSDSIGIIIEKIENNQVNVLWSNFHNPFYNTFGRPGGMINYAQVARKMFTVQSLPQGAIPFYLDETTRKGES